jgi:hypothetical protein
MDRIMVPMNIKTRLVMVKYFTSRKGLAFSAGGGSVADRAGVFFVFIFAIVGMVSATVEDPRRL